MEDHDSFDVNGISCKIRIANDRHSREESYRFMYEIYSTIDYGQPHSSRMWYSLHEILPQTITTTVHHRDDILATMTVAFDSPFGIPADDVFKREMQQRRAKGQRFAEVFSLGIRDDVRGSRLLLGKLINFSYLSSRYILGATHWVITVVPRHAAFYINQMLFEQVKGEGFHEKTGVNCVLLVHPLATFDEVPEKVRKRTFGRYYMPRADEPLMVEHLRSLIHPISDEDFNYFLAKKPELWPKVTSDQGVTRRESMYQFLGRRLDETMMYWAPFPKFS